jgi:hypothetical protein
MMTAINAARKSISTITREHENEFGIKRATATHKRLHWRNSGMEIKEEKKEKKKLGKSAHAKSTEYR